MLQNQNAQEIHPLSDSGQTQKPAPTDSVTNFASALYRPGNNEFTKQLATAAGGDGQNKVGDGPPANSPKEADSNKSSQQRDASENRDRDFYNWNGMDNQKLRTAKDQAKEIAHKHAPEGKEGEKLRQAQDAVLGGDSKSLRELAQKLNTMSTDDREKFVDQLHQSLNKAGAKIDVSYDSEKSKLILHTKDADKGVSIDANGVKIIGVDKDGSINGKTFVGNTSEALSNIGDLAVKQINTAQRGGGEGARPGPAPDGPQQNPGTAPGSESQPSRPSRTEPASPFSPIAPSREKAPIIPGGPGGSGGTTPTIPGKPGG